MNRTFRGDPFPQEYQAKCIFVMPYIALCPGSRKSYQEKHGRSQIVQGVSLLEHTSGEQGNAHGHQNTVQGTAEHTAIRRVGTGAGICVFQLGHVWSFFFWFLSTTSLQGSRSKPSSWGLFWHWSGCSCLSISYFIPFVMWIFSDIFHIALIWTTPVFSIFFANQRSITSARSSKGTLLSF